MKSCTMRTAGGHKSIPAGVRPVGGWVRPICRQGAWPSVGMGQVAECLDTASFDILRREAELMNQGHGWLLVGPVWEPGWVSLQFGELTEPVLSSGMTFMDIKNVIFIRQLENISRRGAERKLPTSFLFGNLSPRWLVRSWADQSLRFSSLT